MNIVRVVILLPILFIAVFPASAQRSVRDIPSEHRAVLREYMNQNRGYDFLPESWFDQDALQEARSDFGSRFKPYYNSADYNGDGRVDFSMVLQYNISSVFGNFGSETLPLTIRIVVFNRTRDGRFTVAREINVLGRQGGNNGRTLFLQRHRGNLYYKYMYTDVCVDMIPAGDGYITEECE